MEAVEKMPLPATQRGKNITLQFAAILLERSPELLGLESDVFDERGSFPAS